MVGRTRALLLAGCELRKKRRLASAFWKALSCHPAFPISPALPQYVLTDYHTKYYAVGLERTLLVCCGSFRADAAAFPNLTVKKIPKAVMHRCEWGRDDYSLEIAALPEAEAAATPRAAVPSRKRARARKSSGGPTLFSLDAGEPADTEEEP